MVHVILFPMKSVLYLLLLLVLVLLLLKTVCFLWVESACPKFVGYPSKLEVLHDRHLCNWWMTSVSNTLFVILRKFYNFFICWSKLSKRNSRIAIVLRCTKVTVLKPRISRNSDATSGPIFKRIFSVLPDECLHARGRVWPRWNNVHIKFWEVRWLWTLRRTLSAVTWGGCV